MGAVMKVNWTVAVATNNPARAPSNAISATYTGALLLNNHSFGDWKNASGSLSSSIASAFPLAHTRFLVSPGFLSLSETPAPTPSQTKMGLCAAAERAKIPGLMLRNARALVFGAHTHRAYMYLSRSCFDDESSEPGLMFLTDATAAARGKTSAPYSGEI